MQQGTENYIRSSGQGFCAIVQNERGGIHAKSGAISRSFLLRSSAWNLINFCRTLDQCCSSQHVPQKPHSLLASKEDCENPLYSVEGEDHAWQSVRTGLEHAHLSSHFLLLQNFRMSFLTLSLRSRLTFSVRLFIKYINSELLS